MSNTDSETLKALIDYLKQQEVLNPEWPDPPVNPFNTGGE